MYSWSLWLGSNSNSTLKSCGESFCMQEPHPWRGSRWTHISSSFAVLYPDLTRLSRYRFAVAGGCRLPPSMVYFRALAFGWAERRVRYAKLPRKHGSEAVPRSLFTSAPQAHAVILSLWPIAIPRYLTRESCTLRDILHSSASYLAGRRHDSMSRSICVRLV